MPSCDNSSFTQTLFLGLSIQSVSMNIGWNGQQSNISVTLIEDTCKPASGTKKVYYPRPGSTAYWTQADPGFQTPTIGAPVYFKFEDFEFAGIVQSWDLKDSPSGKIYSVSIADPRLLLENLTVIISDYASNVGGVPNLINPYGYLESLGYPCAQQFINGASFGSPAGGFGGANNNDQGTPFNLLRDATQALLCGVIDPDFSPYGFARFRGNNPVYGSPAMGIIAADDFDAQVIADYNGNGYGASYYVDISDIPFAPQYFRLAGPQDTLMNMISNVCTIAGCDYYVELLITPSLTKIIKVRTSRRNLQPTLGVIEDYLNTTTLDVTQRDIGRELRNENTSSFLYGGSLQTVYEQGEPNTTSQANNSIIQHWGYDSEGKLNAATHNAGTDEWTVTLDLRPLNVNLLKALGANTVDVSEEEMRLAICDVDAWKTYALMQGSTTALGDLLIAQYPSVVVLPLGNNAPIEPVNAPFAGAANINALGNNAANDPDSNAAKDLAKVHEFLKDFADELYGKKFLVRLPFVCLQEDSDSGKMTYSDNPTSNGGYPARGISDVLTLSFPSTELDFFSSKEQLVQPFAYFDTAVTGAFPKSTESSIVHNDDLFVKATVDEKIVDYNSLPAALITLSAIVEDSTGIHPLEAGNKIIINQVHGENISSGISLGASAAPAGRGADDLYGACYKRRTPDAAAVPMISNTDRYGPYGYQGPSGPVSFQAADNIVPWNFGGYTTMDVAAAEQAEDGVTYMQVGEKGSITFVGSPRHRLGQEIKSSMESFANVAGQTTTVTVGGNTFSFQKFPMYQWVGNLGPSITSISISIGGQGVTTSYTLSTFSPTFGKMAKYNANRLSILGKHRQEIQRTERDRLKIAKQMAIAEAKANAAMGAIKAMKVADKNIGTGGTTVTSAAINTGPADTVFEGRKNSSTQASTASRYTNSAHQSGVAAESMDAKWVAVSKSGDSDLPQYATPVDACSGSGGMYTPGTTPQMDPPIGEWTEPITNISYLDPYYTPNNPKHKHTTDSTSLHNDIQNIANGTPEDNSIINLPAAEAAGHDYPEDFRMIAHKGPMLLHGWGYDTEGKPVPNYVDDADNARAGTFESEGLKDTFLSGWLHKQDTWPVAPIDLRFDRTRAVWTIPNQFRIGIATATGSSVDGDGATLKNLAQTYDSDGNPLTSGSIIYTVPDGMIAPKVGDNFFAFYDNVDCTYYPIVSNSLSVISSGCDASGSGDYEAGGAGYPFPSISDVTNLVLGRGLGLSTVCLSGTSTGTGECEEGLTSSNFMNDPDGAHTPIIELNLTITGQSNFCSGEAKPTGGFLESLTFGSGFTLSKNTGENSGCGDFTVDPILQRLSHFTCTGGSGDVQDAVYSGLLFSTGIGVENSGDCTYTIVSDIRITNATGICNTGTDIPVSGQRFTNLTFGTGLNVTSGDNECSFNIDSDHYIGYASGCSGNETGDFNFFNKLLFSTGLAVSNVSGCTYSIASTKTLSSENCGTGTGFAIFTEVPYENLKFSSGLGVTQLGCDYTIQSTLSVSDGEYCDHTGEELIASSLFEHLEFGSGLYLSTGTGQLGSGCGFSVHADHSIKSTATCGVELDDDSPSDYTFFNKLNFSSGLQVTGSGCEFTISSTNTITGEAVCGGTGLEGGFYNNLIIGSGLTLEASGDCSYKISSDFKVGSSGVCGNDEVVPESVTTLILGTGLKYEGGGDCTGIISSDISITGLATCTGTGNAGGLFSELQIGTGLTLESGPDCSYVIHSDFKVGALSGCGNPAVAPFPVTTLMLGTGLKYEDSGNCSGIISSDISITGLATCTGTGNEGGLFSELQIGSGLTLASSGDCKYAIHSDFKVGALSGCGNPAVDPSLVTTLMLGTGLRYEGDSCSGTISSDFKVGSSGVCGNDAVAPENVSTLILGTGLKYEGGGDCTGTIRSDIRVVGLATCAGAANDGGVFNVLQIGTGLTLESGLGCSYAIHSDFKVGSLSGCGTDGVDPSSVTTLMLGTGLKYEDVGSCSGTISSDITISSTGATLVPTDSIDSKAFKNLSFTSGFGVRHLGDCVYEIYSSGAEEAAISYISNSGCGATEPNFQPTQHLVFSTGLGVTQNVDSANSWLIEGPKVSGIGYCGYAFDWGGKSFDTLTFGSGLKNSGTDCNPIIDVERYISTDGLCGTETIPEQFFKKLIFSTGMEVKDLNDCNFQISSAHKIKDDEYCGHSPSVANHTAYTKLNFGSGLKITGAACEFGIVADHSISDIAYCDYSPEIPPESFFTNIAFGSGLQVTGADCSYGVNVSRFVQDTGYCTYSPTVASDKQYFETLIFGSGLKISGGSCDFTIDADHRIKADSVCGSPSVADQLFRLLTFSTGIDVKDDGDCEFTIGSSRRISKNTCTNSLSINNVPFDLLYFSTGIDVEKTGANCDYIIKSAHKITDSPYCGYSNTSLANKPYEHLKFGSGLYVAGNPLAACEYAINVHRAIRDDGYCNYAPSVLDDTYYDKLVFGSGLKVTGNASDCTYGIYADHSITSTASTSVGSDVSVADQFFRNLSFTSGMGVRSLGDCSYEIWAGSATIRDDGYCDHTPAVLDGTTFDKLVFGTGLKVTGSNSEYGISADHSISATGTTFSDSESSIKSGFFNNLSFTSGMGVRSLGGCSYEIWSSGDGGSVTIRDDGYCDHTNPTVLDGTTFDKLIFSTGLRVTGSSSEYGIIADHSISATGTTFSDSESSIKSGFFNNLSFTSGMGVRSLDGCSYEIWSSGDGGSVTIRDDGYCDHTPTVLETTFDKLVFGTGLKVTGSSSEYGISADHSISATGTTLSDSESSIRSGFFNNLSFTSGLGVRSLGSCSYEIWSSGTGGGGGSTFISNTGCWNTGAYGLVKQTSSHLVFSTGLKVSEKTDEANAWFIEGPKISVSQCATPFYPRYRVPFDELVFSSGFSTGLDSTDCRPVIIGPKIGGLASCMANSNPENGAQNWGGLPFDTLIFGTGFTRTVHPDGDCYPIVNAPQYVARSGNCETPLASTFFNELIFTTGVSIAATEEGDNCSFIISGPRVSGIGSCYANGGAAGAGNWGGMPFQQLTFGTGFSQSGGTDCNPIVHAAQYVSGSGCADFPKSFFHDLIFTTGINIASTGGDDSCSFFISGPTISGEKWCEGSECLGLNAADCLPMYTGESPFSRLVVSTGLSLIEGDCGTKILMNPMKVINSPHCIGRPLSPTDPKLFKELDDSDQESYTELNFARGLTAKYYPEMCAHDIFLDMDMTGVNHFHEDGVVNGVSGCDPLSVWTGTPDDVDEIFAGPGVYIKGSDDGCESIFYTDFRVKGHSGECDSMQLATWSHIENLELGCGLLLSPSEATLCDKKVGVKIDINPNAGRPSGPEHPCHGGQASGVTVVRDVCCTGDHLTINYLTINFSKCGLFTHVSNDDGICDCEP